MDGTAEGMESNSDLVRLAARLIIEEALEAEAKDAAGRDYYARGAATVNRRRRLTPDRRAKLTPWDGAWRWTAPLG
jgi:transposase-like protein